MSERDQDRKQQYRRVRSDFDDLDTEDKVVFLLEATVATLARGIDEFGRAMSEELNKAFSRRAEKKANHDAKTEEQSRPTDADEPSATNGSAETDEKDDSTP